MYVCDPGVARSSSCRNMPRRDPTVDRYVHRGAPVARFSPVKCDLDVHTTCIRMSSAASLRQSWKRWPSRTQLLFHCDFWRIALTFRLIEKYRGVFDCLPRRFLHDELIRAMFPDSITSFDPKLKELLRFPRSPGEAGTSHAPPECIPGSAALFLIL